MVLARLGKGVHGGYLPANDVFYTPGNPFGTGDNIGPNEVAFAGTDTTLVLTGLLPATTYHFALLSYNNNAAGVQVKYNRAGFVRASQTTSVPMAR